MIAAISTGERIGQHGLTPSRLWSSVYCAIALAYGLTYLGVLVRRPFGWMRALRPANLWLAVGVCGVVLLLSMPLISFPAIATHDQLARLDSGRTPAAKFDFGALRFEFGADGLAATKQLAAHGKTAEIRDGAKTALAATNLWAYRSLQTTVTHLTVLPKAVPISKDLLKLVDERNYLCGNSTPCYLIYREGEHEAVLVGGRIANKFRQDADGKWVDRDADSEETQDQARNAERRIVAALARHDVEIRTVTRRQVFAGGEPVGDPFQ